MLPLQIEWFSNRAVNFYLLENEFVFSSLNAIVFIVYFARILELGAYPPNTGSRIGGHSQLMATHSIDQTTNWILFNSLNIHTV